MQKSHREAGISSFGIGSLRNGHQNVFILKFYANNRQNDYNILIYDTLSCITWYIIEQVYLHIHLIVDNYVRGLYISSLY